MVLSSCVCHDWDFLQSTAPAEGPACDGSHLPAGRGAPRRLSPGGRGGAGHEGARQRLALASCARACVPLPPAPSMPAPAAGDGVCAAPSDAPAMRRAPCCAAAWLRSARPRASAARRTPSLQASSRQRSACGVPCRAPPLREPARAPPARLPAADARAPRPAFSDPAHACGVAHGHGGRAQAPPAPAGA